MKESLKRLNMSDLQRKKNFHEYPRVNGRMAIFIPVFKHASSHPYPLCLLVIFSVLSCLQIA